MTNHAPALVAIMGSTIVNLMDAMAMIETMALSEKATKAEIAALAGNAIEAAKALTKAH
jgi:hypothetical protein